MTPVLIQDALDVGVPDSGGAVLSANGRYRYSLTRRWASGPVAVFIMLNPSTADACEDDPTIRRCAGFARRFGCAGLHVVNLYALRTPRPRDLWDAADPVGPGNDATLQAVARSIRDQAGPLVAAWGAGAEPDRVEHVLRLLHGTGPLVALGVTVDGHPRHPLYLRRDADPTPWSLQRQRAIATARRATGATVGVVS